MRGITVTSKVDLEILINCTCGASLEVSEVDEGRDGTTITVEPCAACRAVEDEQ